MFNEKQEEAIHSLQGRVRVIAGAGSGKTSVLTQRYAELIKSGVNPENILCVTFTNKAANEMKQRIRTVTDVNELPYICTFHSFCLKLLREHAHILGYPDNFAILDGDDQNAVIRDVFKECNINKDDISYNTAKGIVSDLKVNEELYLLNVFKPDNTIKNLYNEAKKDLKESFFNKTPLQKQAIYFGYLYHQQKATAMDFDDMIILTCIILKQCPEVLDKWQKQFNYIMVDEFQDASKRQNELVEMLSEKHGNLFVVGDPDQTIYTWRGAKPEILVNFDKKKQTKTVIMNQNYRSTPNILEVANDIISKNTLRVEKDLFTKNPKGDKVFHGHFESPKQEAEWIADTIKKALKKYAAKDIVILYRMHFLSRAVEEQLIQKKIPYVIHSGTNFYERKEIKDVLAYLKLIVNSNDDVSLKRIINVPTRGIGSKTIDDLKKYAEMKDCSLWDACNHFMKNKSSQKLQDFVLLINMLKSKEMSIEKTAKFVLEKTGYGDLLKNSLEPERKENVQELLESMRDFKGNLDEYLQEITLLTNTDKRTGDKVTLMTIHSAKGLEWPIVFVIGMSEGQFPCARSIGNKQNEEEERRLAYVAYTRAKEKLILTDSEGNDFNGNERKTSRFIKEIDDSLLDTNKRKPITGTYKPKAFVVKKNKPKLDSRIEQIINIGREEGIEFENIQCECISANSLTREDTYALGKHVGACGQLRGQYFENGNYYDWDDPTYLQGSLSAEDIF